MLTKKIGWGPFPNYGYRENQTENPAKAFMKDTSLEGMSQSLSEQRNEVYLQIDSGIV